MDIRKLSCKDLEKIFGISDTTRRRWDNDGCPRNKDRSYSSAAVHKWYRDTKVCPQPSPASTGEVELTKLRGEKLKKDISLMDLDLQEKMRETMLRSEHARAIADRATRWQTMVSQTLPRQAHMFIKLETVEAARARLHELAVVFADVWRLTPEELEQEGYSADENGIHSLTKEVENV